MSIGPNMLLSEDQSAFVNPAVLDWDPTVKYVAGQVVRSGNYEFRAVTTALGYAQSPPITATSNATWEYVGYPRMTTALNRPDTGDVSTWQVRLSGQPGNGAVSGLTKVAVGATDATWNGKPYA